MVTKRNEQARKRNEFIGAHEGAVIVGWMNNPKRPPNDEVEQLIGLAVRYQASLGVQKVDAAKVLYELFRNTVHRWSLGNSPAIDYDQTGELTFTLHPMSNPEDVSPDQMLAFWKCWELMQINMLTRVRRCRRPGCGRWFFAVFDNAFYHENQCRVKVMASKPEFREHRRKYMQQRRKKRK